MKFEEYWYYFNLLSGQTYRKMLDFFNNTETYMWNSFVVWNAI